MIKIQYQAQLNQAMEGIAFDIENALKDKLTKAHGVDEGTLKSSIKARAVGNDVEITMDEHGKWLEYGTNPHGINKEGIERLRDWARRKMGLAGRTEESDAFAYAVAWSIRRRGTRPYPFIRTTYHQDVINIVKRNLKQAFK